MKRFDVRISGGKIYTPAGLLKGDILIDQDKIAAIVEHEVKAEARKEINAKGKTILPGIIDLHCHTREPGYTKKEDFLSASKAAAAGGVTTLIAQPNVEPPVNDAESLLATKAIAEEKAIVDFGQLVFPTYKNIESIAKAGATGYKVFQVGGAYPHDPRLAMNDDGDLYKAFKVISTTGLFCAVHPFNQSLFDTLSEEAWAQGEPKNHMTFAKLYVKESIWSSAVSTLIYLQRETGARIHLMHTSATRSLRMVREAKAAGQKITAECDPKYFHLTKKDLDEKGPLACPAGYVTEDEERMQEIWRSLNDGTLCIGSDHAPHLIEEEEKQKENAWDAAMGSPQYDHYLSIFTTDYHKKKITLETMVRILSEDTAKILGIYPQKGAIQVGSDADLIIVDMEKEFIVNSDQLYTKCGWTPYEGWEMKGKPVLTMVRGTVVMEDGQITGEPGYGKYIIGRPLIN